MWVGWTERETSAGRLFEGLYESVEAAAFWAAVVFPASYVPFLTDGIGTIERGVAFAALVAMHLVLLAVGHTYQR